MNSYDRAYQELNSEQKQAVDHIDGPLLVIAGPGTGKTELLSTRVANILRQPDTAPNSILCLTFTNKAVENMKQRLIKLIGAEANNIFVRTFHSFAAEIMNRYPEHFWNGARLSMAPDAVQLEITQQILDSLPANHVLSLKFAGQYTLIKDVQQAINLTKEAGLTPDKLRTLIDANISYIDEIEPLLAEIGSTRVTSKAITKFSDIVQALPNQKIQEYIHPIRSLSAVIKDSYSQALAQFEETQKTSAVSQWKRRWVQPIDGNYKMGSERSRNDWWLGLADAYEAYRKQLHQRGYYDYSDMLVEVIGQIEQQPNLRAEIQEQFQYVLIDEFQDTNAAQLRMAHLIADHFTSEGSPNLMVVGDDDQSIFKFQGAELSNMLGFHRDYKKATTIVLTKNYRSSQEVLKAGSQIINHANYRLVNKLADVSKDLTAAVNRKPSHIEHQRFRSRAEQLSGVADEVAKLFSKGQSVALLARSHVSLRDMASVLIEKGIPIRYEQSNDIFEKPAVQQLMGLLRITQAIKTGNKLLTSELLSDTLSHPMWDLPPKALWSFAMNQSNRDDWYGRLLSSKDSKFAQIGIFISELVKLSASEPTGVVVEYAMGLRTSSSIVSPIKSYYLDQRSVGQHYLETLSAMQLFRTLASEYSARRSASVGDFVGLADLLEQNDKILADTTPFQNGDKYVELLSVHKAKGLEFDAVAIIDVCNDEWSPTHRGRTPPANLPLRAAEDDADDYARLMYVAATRAKNTLIASSYEYSVKGEPVASSHLVENLPLKRMPAQTGQQLIETLETTLLWPRLDKTDEKQLLKSWLEGYSMSVTHLINFLDISSGGPQYFFERHVLRLPSAKSPAASLGSAIHSALQLAQNLTNQDKFKFSDVTGQFEKSLKVEGLPSKDLNKKLTQGRQILNHLFGNLKFLPIKGNKPEYAINGVLLGEARLNGKLDVIGKNTDNIIITDYKTGRPLLSLNSKSGAAGVKAWKHRLQLTYYALLAQLEPQLKAKGEVTSQMLYVEAKTAKELTKQYRPSPDEITRLSSLIKAVWNHVQNLDFPSAKHYSSDYQGISSFEQDLLDKKI